MLFDSCECDCGCEPFDGIGELYTPSDNLELWSLPDCYFGAEWEGYYVFLFRSRDSDILEESNFECGLKLIGGESETVHIIREGHWAVGWVEWIAIHKSNWKALKEADGILDALSDYPVIDESDWSEREYNAAGEAWEQASIAERIDLIKRYCDLDSVSIFAARRDYMPEDYNGGLQEALIGH